MEIKPLSAPIALGHPEFDSIVHVARLIQKIQKSSRNGIHPSEISRPWADIVDDEDFEPLEVGGDFIYQIILPVDLQVACVLHVSVFDFVGVNALTCFWLNSLVTTR